MNLTQGIKNNWLKALKSGEYTQFEGRLEESANSKSCCCLGVLAIIHPDLSINHENNMGCIIRGIDKGYSAFFDILGDERLTKLYRENDNSYNLGVRDYSTVIPLIEALPTID